MEKIMKSILKEIVEKVFGEDCDEEILTPEVMAQNDKVCDMADEVLATLDEKQQELFHRFVDEESHSDMLTEDECTLRAFRKGILFGLELSEYYRK